jgi:hypothetical protein
MPRIRCGAPPDARSSCDRIALGNHWLEYLTPRDGRPVLPEARENDRIRWHTLVLTPDAEAAAQRLGASPGATRGLRVVPISNATLGSAKDSRRVIPGGHSLQLRAK